MNVAQHSVPLAVGAVNVEHAIVSVNIYILTKDV